MISEIGGLKYLAGVAGIKGQKYLCDLYFGLLEWENEIIALR